MIRFPTQTNSTVSKSILMTLRTSITDISTITPSPASINITHEVREKLIGGRIFGQRARMWEKKIQT